MPSIISELSSVELLELSKCCKFILQRKLSRGVEMVDLRTWTRWHKDDQYHSSKNGLFIERSKLLEVIDAIKANII